MTEPLRCFCFNGLAGHDPGCPLLGVSKRVSALEQKVPHIEEAIARCRKCGCSIGYCPACFDQRMEGASWEQRIAALESKLAEVEKRLDAHKSGPWVTCGFCGTVTEAHGSEQHYEKFHREPPPAARPEAPQSGEAPTRDPLAEISALYERVAALEQINADCAEDVRETARSTREDWKRKRFGEPITLHRPRGGTLLWAECAQPDGCGYELHRTAHFDAPVRAGGEAKPRCGFNSDGVICNEQEESATHAPCFGDTGFCNPPTFTCHPFTPVAQGRGGEEKETNEGGVVLTGRTPAVRTPTGDEGSSPSSSTTPPVSSAAQERCAYPMCDLPEKPGAGWSSVHKPKAGVKENRLSHAFVPPAPPAGEGEPEGFREFIDQKVLRASGSTNRTNSPTFAASIWLVRPGRPHTSGGTTPPWWRCASTTTMSRLPSPA